MIRQAIIRSDKQWGCSKRGSGGSLIVKQFAEMQLRNRAEELERWQSSLTKEMLNKKALECISGDAVISMFELQSVEELLVRVGLAEEVIISLHLCGKGAQTQTLRV